MEDGSECTIASQRLQLVYINGPNGRSRKALCNSLMAIRRMTAARKSLVPKVLTLYPWVRNLSSEDDRPFTIEEQYLVHWNDSITSNGVWMFPKKGKWTEAKRVEGLSVHSGSLRYDLKRREEAAFVWVAKAEQSSSSVVHTTPNISHPSPHKNLFTSPSSPLTTSAKLV